MTSGVQPFARDESGNISPLYALVLMVLVALAGIGFDYGRLMAMQSELRNAAIQSGSEKNFSYHRSDQPGGGKVR